MFLHLSLPPGFLLLVLVVLFLLLPLMLLTPVPINSVALASAG